MLKDTKEALNLFAKYVIQQARTNLSKKNIRPNNDTKGLYNALDYELKETGSGFKLIMYINPKDGPPYGDFQDQGVSGTHQKFSNTKFSYKPSSNLVGMEYHTGTFAKYAKRKNLQLRNAKGQFMTYKQTGFKLATIIKKYGIKPSLYFTKPFARAFMRLPQELIEAYANDQIQFITKRL